MGGRHPRPALAVSVEHFVGNPSQRPDHHRGPASTRLGSLLRVAASGRCVLGAGDETRTRDIDLGKVALCQLSYSRSASRILASPFRSSWHIGQMTTINSAMRAAVRLIWLASKISTA